MPPIKKDNRDKCRDLAKGDFLCSRCGCLLLLGGYTPSLYDKTGKPAAPNFCPLCGLEIDKYAA